MKNFNLIIALLLYIITLFSPVVKAQYSNDYYLLNPKFKEGDIIVTSYRDNNKITFGDQSLALNKGQQGVFDPTQVEDLRIFGTGSFTVTSDVLGTDMATPASLAGTTFGVLINKTSTNVHNFHLFSPHREANVTLDFGSSASSIDVTLVPGVLTTVEQANLALQTVIVTSENDVPILLSYNFYPGSSSGLDLADQLFREVISVPPAAKEFFGVDSKAIVGAIENNTVIEVFTSDNTESTITLHAGELLKPNISSVTHGQGGALRLRSEQPFIAGQYADGDGVDKTVFSSRSLLSNEFILPEDAQYVAFACPEANTEITISRYSNLLDVDAPPQQLNCNANGDYPGKALYGIDDQINLAVGARISSNKPVHVYYDAHNSEDEKNITGEQYAYYVLNPAIETGNIILTSFVDGNEIMIGSSSISLDRHESQTISSQNYQIVQGTKISGSGPFQAISNTGETGIDATASDLLAPVHYASTDFVIPQTRSTYTPNLYLLSTDQDAYVSVEMTLPDGTPHNLVVDMDMGVVRELALPNTDGNAIIIHSNLPVLAEFGQKNSSGLPKDAFPLSSPREEWLGVLTRNTAVAALQDNTIITMHSSSGWTSGEVHLNKGEQFEFNDIPIFQATGLLDAVKIESNHPVFAAEFADGSGADASAFSSVDQLGYRYVLPTDAAYIAIACGTEGTLKLSRDSAVLKQLITVRPPSSTTPSYFKDCYADGDQPGKLVIDDLTPELLAAGTVIESSAPIHVYYDDDATRDERNLIGAADDRKSNILLVLIDDWGKDMFSETDRPEWPSRVLPDTPVLSGLFNAGVHFENAWVNPQCSPTRASLLTGRYAFRTDVQSAGAQLGNEDRSPLSEDEYTIPEMLDRYPELGYEHAAFGKWHLSDFRLRDENGDVVTTDEQPECETLGVVSTICIDQSLLDMVSKAGFGYYAGTLLPNLSTGINPGVDDFYDWEQLINSRDTDGVITVQRNDIVNKFATIEHVDQARDWINQQGDNNWFTYLAFNAAHSPFCEPPSELVNTDYGFTSEDTRNGNDNPCAMASYGLTPEFPIDNELDTRRYKAMIEAIDTELGRLLYGNNTPNNSGLPLDVLARTVVIVLGDNGSPQMVHLEALPLNSAKSSLYEGGVNVPFFVSGANVTVPGTIDSSMVNVTDVFSTIMDIADAPIPDNLVQDSFSFYPMLKGQQGALRKENYTFLRNFRTISDGQYKLLRFITTDKTRVFREELRNISETPFEDWSDSESYSIITERFVYHEDGSFEYISEINSDYVESLTPQEVDKYCELKSKLENLVPPEDDDYFVLSAELDICLAAN